MSFYLYNLMHARVLEQYQTWYCIFQNLLLCHATLLFLSFLCVPSIVAAATHADIHCQCASPRYISVFTIAEFRSTTTPLGRMEEPLLVSRTNKVALNSLTHRSLWAREGWSAAKRHWFCGSHWNRSFQDSFTDFPSRRSRGRSLGLHIEFDMFACLLGVKCYFIIVLIWIPLITCGTEHCFMCINLSGFLLWCLPVCILFGLPYLDCFLFYCF